MASRVASVPSTKKAGKGAIAHLVGGGIGLSFPVLARSGIKAKKQVDRVGRAVGGIQNENLRGQGSLRSVVQNSISTCDLSYNGLSDLLSPVGQKFCGGVMLPRQHAEGILVAA